MVEIFVESTLPEELRVINLNEDYFRLFTRNELKKSVDKTIIDTLKFIDGSEYLGTDAVRTRFGLIRGFDKCSTGCKTILNGYMNSDKNEVFSLSQSGYNAVSWALTLAKGKYLMITPCGIDPDISIDTTFDCIFHLPEGDIICEDWYDVVRALEKVRYSNWP